MKVTRFIVNAITALVAVIAAAFLVPSASAQLPAKAPNRESKVVASAEATTTENGLFRRAAGKPLKGRYIVILNDETKPEDVDGIARGLSAMHGGKLLGVMKSAVRGFGVSLPEQAARALARNPHGQAGGRR